MNQRTRIKICGLTREADLSAAVDAGADASGKQEKYWVEMSNLTQMVLRGITPTSFKKGDKVTVKMHPLKDGRKGGSYLLVTTADGKSYE